MALFTNRPMLIIIIIIIIIITVNILGRGLYAVY